MAEAVERVRAFAETVIWELNAKVQELEAEGAELVEELRDRQGRCGEMLRQYAEMRKEKERAEEEGRKIGQDMEKVKQWVKTVKTDTLQMYHQRHSKVISILATHTNSVAEATRESHLPTIVAFRAQLTLLETELQALERQEAELSEALRSETAELEKLKKAKEELRRDLNRAFQELKHTS
jgi:chromosome segregation ATPase